MPEFPRPRHASATPLPDVAAALAAAGLQARADAPGSTGPAAVTGVTFDSRAVRPGDLYAALPGANVHGARFAADAATAGAAALLTDGAGLATARDAGVDLPVLVVDDPRAALGPAAKVVYSDATGVAEPTLLGITGTNGKTTTAFILDGALRSLGRTTGLIGTVETRVGDERIVSERTTPEASDLHGLLVTMGERGVDTCTMEVSSHAMVLHRVDGARFAVAGFTNLSQDHLDFHPTMEDYFAAKASLFTPEHADRAVVVVDDDWGLRLARETTLPVQTIASTPDRGADWVVERDDSGPAFRLRRAATGESVDVVSPLPGDFNQLNTALAAVMLVQTGVDVREACAAVATDPRVPGRMERVVVADGQPLAVVDFAHTPEAVASALAALRGQVPGRLVAVLGAGGDRDPGKRPHMGAAAARGADRVVVTDDNPRSEDPAAIRAAVLSGVPADRRDAVTEVPGRDAAIAEAVRGLGPDDAVVVLGKGHETGQTIGTVVHHFDDREQLAAALRGAPGPSAATPTVLPAAPAADQTPEETAR